MGHDSPDLTTCTGCEIGWGGITTGCADCCRRFPDRYAAMTRDLSNEEYAARQVAIAAEQWFMAHSDLPFRSCSYDDPADADQALADAVQMWKQR